MSNEDKQYANREIDTMFDAVHQKLDAILEQTKKTNGRVNSLENWKYFITGGLTIVGAILIPIALKIWL